MALPTGRVRDTECADVSPVSRALFTRDIRVRSCSVRVRQLLNDKLSN